MAITPAGTSALAGIQRGMDGLQRSAAEIASAERMDGAGTEGLAEPLVAQIQHASQVGASVRVLETEHRMLGSLLDLKA
jgi:hypothetical protein